MTPQRMSKLNRWTSPPSLAETVRLDDLRPAVVDDEHTAVQSVGPGLHQVQ